MEYEVKGIPTKITATSRVAIKIKDNYYTVECSEERSIPDVEGVDIEKERQALFDTVNATVDGQIADIYDTFKKK
jgi:hypothetical protein